jgi:hypothetical protein
MAELVAVRRGADAAVRAALAMKRLKAAGSV